jgi:hypothetical protein
MDCYNSDKLIKILFFSEVILNKNISTQPNLRTIIPDKNINVKPNSLASATQFPLQTNVATPYLFTQYYKNNELLINDNNIKHIKKLYDINNNNISDIITYLFIDNTFEIPKNKTTIDLTQINYLTNQLNDLDLNIENNTILTKDELKIKLSENINISLEYENLYNPHKNIIGHIFINNEHNIYDKIIHYTSEEFLLLNEPLLKNKTLSFKILSNIILNMLNNNEDITSYNIKRDIDNQKNIEYNINITLPYYIINHFKPKRIININEDYGQWLFVSNFLNVDTLISINQYKMSQKTINNINDLSKKKINFKSTDDDYLFDDYNIDLIYYNCNFLYENSYFNIKDIIYNECFFKLKSTWDLLNNNGYLLINVHDIENKKITEIINLYIGKLHDSEYKGILCLNKNSNIYPIWVYKKNNTNNKQTNIINDIYNNYINKL